ncbi:MAG: hypothetical protein H6737_09410 [Alphaproteobacteria bacterium]|nr:hypothetical protein [Alphaproteobacteria bacterium]
MFWTALLVSALAGPPRAALKTTALMPKTILKPGDPVNIFLAMENRTDEVLWFEQHTIPACFIHKFAEIEANPPITMKPLPEGGCDAPSAKVKPNGVVSMTVDLKEVFDLPEVPYTYFTVKWKDGGPDIYSPLTQRTGPVKFQQPFFEGKIKKGGDFYLTNKTTVVWNGHQSQQPTQPGDPPSLVIDFLVRIPGTGEAPRKITVPLHRTRQFVLEGYTVEIVDHQFDQYMDIRIYEP